MKQRKRKLLLLFFCMAFCGSSIYVMFHSFQHVQPVKVQQIIISPSIKEQRSAVIISKDEYQRIEQYKKDSGFSIRPSLMDSINQIEIIYLSQQRNKK